MMFFPALSLLSPFLIHLCYSVPDFFYYPSWAQVAYITSPLATPWWAEGTAIPQSIPAKHVDHDPTANVLTGFVFFFWIVTPIIYYKNIFFTSFLPIQSNTSYDRFGNEYNVTAILKPDLTIDLEKYRNYSPLFLSATFSLAYGLSFASITATIVHTFLYFRKQIWVQARRSLHEQPDIHARLMSRYPQVPDWYVCLVWIQFSSVNVYEGGTWLSSLPCSYLASLSLKYGRPTSWVIFHHQTDTFLNIP